MSNLVKGDKVKIKYGGEAVVKEELGAGGQGTVYKVSYNGKEYALKWYHKNVFGNRKQDSYDNIEKILTRVHQVTSFYGL